MDVTDGPGPRIRERRLARGVPQAALARACGISPSYLNRIERGRRGVGGALLRRLAEALGAEPGALARGAPADLLAELRAAAPEDPEISPPEAFAAREPAWAALVVAQARRVQALERADSDPRRPARPTTPRWPPRCTRC